MIRRIPILRGYGAGEGDPAKKTPVQCPERPQPRETKVGRTLRIRHHEENAYARRLGVDSPSAGRRALTPVANRSPNGLS